MLDLERHPATGVRQHERLLDEQVAPDAARKGAGAARALHRSRSGQHAADRAGQGALRREPGSGHGSARSGRSVEDTLGKADTTSRASASCSRSYQIAGAGPRSTRWNGSSPTTPSGSAPPCCPPRGPTSACRPRSTPSGSRRSASTCRPRVLIARARRDVHARHARDAGAGAAGRRKRSASPPSDYRDVIRRAQEGQVIPNERAGGALRRRPRRLEEIAARERIVDSAGVPDAHAPGSDGRERRAARRRTCSRRR